VNFFSPVKTVRISEEIESQIRSAILADHFKEGDRLPSESELSKIFNTSRTTVREALRALEREGFIVIKQGVKGGSYIQEGDVSPVIRSFAHVMRFNNVTLENLTEARIAIEPEVGRLAALRSTKDDIERMEEALSELRQIVEEGRRSTSTNVKFHRVLAEGCKNPVLFFVSHSLMNMLEESLSKLTLDLNKNRLLLQEHSRIYEAIKERNPEEACSALKSHIHTVRRIMKPQLKQNEHALRGQFHERLKEPRRPRRRNNRAVETGDLGSV